MSISDEMCGSIHVLPYTFRDGAVLVTLNSVSSVNSVLIVNSAECYCNDQPVILDFPLYYVNPPSIVDDNSNLLLVMERMIADTVREFAGK